MQIKRKNLTAMAMGLVSLLSVRPASAAFSWPGCPDVQESEFKYQALVGKSTALSPKVVDATMNEPIKMAFDLRPDNSTDVYWVERTGAIKRYFAAENKVVKIGQLGVYNDKEQGLSGLAVDPAFRTNHWIYVFYAPTAENNVFRISRFTLNADLTSMADEKVLIKIPSQRASCCHTGGAMSFDKYNDLWIAVGKNAPDYPRSINESNEASSTESTAADASDMRGGVIRIHPDNSTKGYTVPSGNYGEYWSKYFKDKGNSTLAAEYADPNKVLPEVYVKGARNPYSLTVDPVRRWVTWGEFGVNLTATMTEEHNLVTHPVNGGYPYFAGGGGTGGTGCTYKNGMCELWRAFDNSAGDKDMNAPVNNSKWNGGPKIMPPVEPAIHTYPRSGAVTGPIYRYAGESPSTIKFPPHFDKAWFIADWRKSWIKIYKVSDDGSKLTDSLTWFEKFGFNNVLDVQQGPDGAIYVNNYEGSFGSTPRTRIGRIEYTGNCRPAQPVSPTPNPTGTLAQTGAEAPMVRLELHSVFVDDLGPHTLHVTDARGHTIADLQGSGPHEYSLASLAKGKKGIFFVNVQSGRGQRVLKAFNL